VNDDLTIHHDAVLFFGDRDDGVIGLPGLTHDGHVIEISYFFGLTRPKNIIVISSQVGCPLGCSFCELDGFVRNLTARELHDQARLMIGEAFRYGFDPTGTPHKVTVADSGEPLLNPFLVSGLESLRDLPVSFKVSTVLPAARAAWRNLERLADFAAGYERPVQLQISLISTSEERRLRSCRGRIAGFDRVREAGELWRSRNPRGRQVNLSLIVTDDMPCEAARVVRIFPPELFRFRFREYVPTRHGAAAGHVAVSPERLRRIKRDFASRGYQVGDWASPSPVERRFGLAANTIRRMYLEAIGFSRKD